MKNKAIRLLLSVMLVTCPVTVSAADIIPADVVLAEYTDEEDMSTENDEDSLVENSVSTEEETEEIIISTEDSSIEENNNSEEAETFVSEDVEVEESLLYADEKSGECGTDLTYEISEDGKILSFKGNGKVMEKAPWRNGSYKTSITTIDFSGAPNLEEIRYDAFREMTSLSNTAGAPVGDIVIPDSVKKIGNSAFYKCSSITGTVTWGANANDCSYLIFANTNVKKVVFKEGLTSIPERAFLDCQSLETITTEDGKATFPSTITKICNNAFNGCTNLKGSIVIPSAVKEIEYHAFSKTGIEGLTLQEGLEKIDYYAFGECPSLKGDIVIPDTVTKMGYGVFNKCTSLDGTVTWGAKANDCSYLIFANTNVKKVVFKEGVTAIPDRAFLDCQSLETITTEDGKATFPSTLTKICNNAFDGCTNLKGSIVIPGAVKEIEYYAFSKTGIEGLTLQEGLEKIDYYAFGECTSLKGDIVIPDTVTKMGYGVFNKCSSLDGTVTWGAKANDCSYLIFANTNVKKVVFKEGVTAIPDRAFYECQSLETITTEDEKANFPSTVTNIEHSAFYGCSALKGDIVIPAGVNEIGSSAFAKCESITGLSFVTDDTKGIKKIGHDAFSKCKSLKGDLVIPDTVTSIGQTAFDGCSGYTGELTIGSKVTEMGASAFANTSFKSIYIKDGCTVIGNMMDTSETLKYVHIPDSVTQFGNSAFNKNAIIEASKGSKAEEWANKQGYKLGAYKSGASGETPTPEGLPTYVPENTTVTTTVKLTKDAPYGTINNGEIPEKNGYGFAGWSTKENDTTKMVTEDTVATRPGNQTLYAVWDEMVLVKGQKYLADEYFKGAIDTYTKATQNVKGAGYKFVAAKYKDDGTKYEGRAKINKKTGLITVSKAGNVKLILQVKDPSTKKYVDYYAIEFKVIEAKPAVITLTDLSAKQNIFNDGKQVGGISYKSGIKDALGNEVKAADSNVATVKYSLAKNSEKYIKLDADGNVTPVAKGTGKVCVTYTTPIGLDKNGVMKYSTVKKTVSVKVKL